MSKISLAKEMETLLIPLYGKAQDCLKEKSILKDKKALHIINTLDYDFTDLKIAEKTNIMMCLRAKLIDDYTVQFLQNKSDVVVLHLGCGLDNRCIRVNSIDADWYELDFLEVMDIRKKFYSETQRYHLIPSSVTDSKWLDKIPKGKKNYIVIAEGLSMYLCEEEIKDLLSRLNHHCNDYTLIMDAYSKLTAKSAKNHPSLKKTGAVIKWGIDNPKDIEQWDHKYKLIDQQYFTMTKYNEQLDFGTRFMFKIANMFSAAKKAHRLLIYKCFENKV